MAFHRLFGSCAVMALATSIATPALGQDVPVDPAQPVPESVSPTPEEAAPASQQGLADIVVTATRRETKLQRTPIAVSVVDQSLIKMASPDNIGDIAIYVPNFSAETITGFNAASFAMRGVGPTTSTGRSAPSRRQSQPTIQSPWQRHALQTAGTW